MLLLTALIWGLSFVVQSVGTGYLGAFTFNGVRFLLGAAALVPCMLLLLFMHKNRQYPAERAAGAFYRIFHNNRSQVREGIKGGICCGIALCTASAIQQTGLAYTSVGKAGFITALYIVIVPLCRLCTGKKTPGKIWFSVAAAVFGLYLLCIKENFSAGFGDCLIFLCSIAFAAHILAIDHFSPKADGIFLSFIQFLTAGVISWGFAFLLETPRLEDIFAARFLVLYAGVVSCGVAFTLQVIAQKNTDPASASLLLSLESVFSAIFGWLILHEILAPKELLGCALVFCGVILAQLPDRPKPVRN